MPIAPTAGPPPAPAAPAAAIPAVRPHVTRCGPVRKSRRFRWRVVAWVAVHVLAFVHIAHWKVTGRTLTPVEPSEAMQTLELGKLNAGFILFFVSILATLILGRFFCGWACHVVAYQDACAWVLRKMGLHPRPFRSRLLVLVPFGAALYMFVWPTVERALLQGREAPPLVEHFTTGSFWRTFPGPWMALLTVLVDGFLIVWFLGAKGFCTYGCPYGAVFGMVDRLAVGKIRVTDACEGCGHCTATCTSNVRVHEEVRLYRMVVDPGCMKCMDCIDVCPKGALYFGFGWPALGAKPRMKRPRRVYDLPWAGEFALAAIFGISLYTWRNLYGAIPFLLTLGLSVLTAFVALLFWRLLRRRDFRMQSLTLRREGRFTAAGAAALVLLPLFFLFVGRSALLQFHVKEGERLLRRAREVPPEERGKVAERSLAHLRSAEALALVDFAPLEMLLGNALSYFEGSREEAERKYRRAVAISPSSLSSRPPRFRLARLAAERQDFAAAEAELVALLAIDPEADDGLEIEARFDLASALKKRGDLEGAARQLVEILRIDPRNALAPVLLAQIR
ncbi:MAG TPA: 4Fe-4S binding protein [Planctomycetota bacterium]|nr:4Fe-4S binding protein [Planctomycetota bacterium]